MTQGKIPYAGTSALRGAGRFAFLILFGSLLGGDGMVGRVFAQDVCQDLQNQLAGLKAELKNEQDALHTTACAGTTKPECIKEITDTQKQIGDVNKQLQQNHCAVVHPPGPVVNLCCGWRVERHPRLVADTNHDGSADIIAFHDDGVWTALSTGHGGFASPRFSFPNLGYNQSWRVEKHVRVMADVNGDGRQDIVAFGDDGVWLALAKADGSFDLPRFVLANFGVNQSWDVSKHVRLVGDVNGDGKADIVAFGDAGVWTALSTGTGFAAPALVIGDFGYNQGWRVGLHERLLADVNGDGRKDIVAFGDDGVWLALANSNGTFAAPAFVIQNFGVHQGWDAAKHVRAVADISGDGKADIVAFGNDGVWTALSTGNGFAAPAFVIADLGYNQGWRVGKHERLLADINGDKKKDIVAFGDDGVWVSLAGANGSLGPPKFVIQNFGANQGWDSSKHVRTVADINGDKKADIVAIGDDGVWTALSNGTGFAAPSFVLADFAYGGNLDVIASADGFDDNGFPRNPVWRGATPEPCNVCPCGEGVTTPSSWNATPGCTIQSLHANTHTGIGEGSYSGLVCAAGGATGLNGLMNWFPAVYEGTLAWGGHSNSVYDDDNYYLTMSRTDEALQTPNRDGVHIEFNSDETVDHWDDTKTWWDDFHHNAVDKDDDTARSYIDGKQVVAIGMVALDLEHDDHHSELHPGYGMFVRLPGSPVAVLSQREKVAFFVRNWGDEGFCAPNQEPIPQRMLQVRLRHSLGSGFSLGENVWTYGDDDECSQQIWSYRKMADGLLLTFSLRDASKKCGFVGDLNINWGNSVVTGTGGVVVKTKAVAKPVHLAHEPDEDGDPVLKGKLAKLSAADRQLLQRQLRTLVRHAKARPKASVAGVPPVAEATRSTAVSPELTALKSVEDPAENANREKKHQFVLSFLKGHGIE